MLAPPRRTNRSPLNEVIDRAQAARLIALRKAFMSSNDKIMAKPAPKFNVAVSFPARVACDLK